MDRSASGTDAVRWGVIGGGQLGMTLALRLAQQGKPVTLLEAGDRLGGLADAWELGDVRWDRHYHVTCLSDTVLRAVLRELGLESEIAWRETQTGFYGPDGRLVPISTNMEILRNLPLSLFAKFRLGLTIQYAARIRDGKRLEHVPVAEWLRKLSGRAAFEQLWLPLLRAKLGDNYRVASASFIWAVIERLSKARRIGLDKERFGYVPGGYGRVNDAFAERLRSLGVEIRLRHPVQRVASDEHGVAVETADGERERFDHVAVTLPAPVAADVCAGLSEDEVRRLRGITYQGLVCSSLLLRRPLAEYYLTYITDQSLPFTAVVEMSTLVDQDAQYGGRSLVYLPTYVTGTDPLLDADDDTIREQCLAGLERMYPHFRREDVLAFRTSKVRNVLAISTLGYSDALPPRTTSVPGVHIVNSAHIVNGTLNVNETMQLAQTEAERLGQLPRWCAALPPQPATTGGERA